MAMPVTISQRPAATPSHLGERRNALNLSPSLEVREAKGVVSDGMVG